ncbi:SDR family NAD(P)-dependent oxidoreductase [Roseixanthobacter glucoisosaccharinicivorans]|uniref:SDR family NAD(P)-dependent oxidoreductase n=1 Tax=Roseixanthobacter glucoisosaccharinicivorans TaxID=3119923 RepID=UPI00372B28DC
MNSFNGERRKTILIVGASRGLGHAMALEFVKKGWHVVGTVRTGGRTDLHALADANPGQIMIEPLDITEPEQISAVHERLRGRVLDILFVNSGIADRDASIPAVKAETDEFVQVMLTNALGVMRAVEGLEDLVGADGLIGVMSSGQGSIANNTRGGFEVYRASKAALNQLMRSYAARHADDPRATVLMAPGWIRTGLGGPNATFSIEETVPTLVGTLLVQRGKPGLRFIDRFGETVPW